MLKKPVLKKLLKPALFTGLGLIGLTVLVGVSASAIARKQTAELDAITTNFVQAHPKLAPTTRNDSAVALEKLASNLGFKNIVGESNNGQFSIDPTPSSEAQANKLKTYEAIRPALSDYLEAQSQKTQGSLDPIPPELKAYLAQNSDDLLAIQTHLLTQDVPIWDFDPDVAADFTYAMPSLLGFIPLQQLLSLKAIDHAQNNQPGDMADALEATLVLQDTAVARPELISYLVSLIMMNSTLGTMRHLEGVPTALTARVASINQSQQAIDYLKIESWQSYRAIQKHARKRDDFFTDVGYDPGLLLIAVHKTRLSEPYLMLIGVDSARMFESAYQQLPNYDICSAPLAEIESQIGVVEPWWNLWSRWYASGLVKQWYKGGQKGLAAELTHHIVRAKAIAAEQGQWPQTLDGLESNVCEGEQWVYEVSEDGKLSLSFSGDREWLSAEKNRLPLTYEATLEQ